jgi:hypothetical protein
MLINVHGIQHACKPKTKESIRTETCESRKTHTGYSLGRHCCSTGCSVRRTGQDVPLDGEDGLARVIQLSMSYQAGVCYSNAVYSVCLRPGV